MAEAREGEAEQPPSPRIHSYARDLLRRFSGGFPEDFRVAESSATEEDSAKIELSLGLSLGGCFGVDPAQRRGLVRSSSVASLPFLQRGEQDPPAIPVLARTCSLPVEAEEEQRKRKELQSLRRLEAKRKRSEKRNNSRVAGRDRAAALAEESRGESMQLDGHGGAEKEEEKAEGERFRAWCPPAPNGTAVARAAARAVEGTRGFAPVPQGSMGSPGSSSSGVSDFDNRPLIRQGSGVSGLGSGTESRSPSIFQPLPNHTESKAAMSPMSPVVGRQPSYTQMEVEDSLKQAAAAAGGGNGLRNMMEEMPCVSTRGSGPGGRKVEGFLYRYRKGEEVRIVCVCHGSFFSPAEFVKHAGGGDVAHPLRHIVVNPNPSSIL